MRHREEMTREVKAAYELVKKYERENYRPKSYFYCKENGLPAPEIDDPDPDNSALYSASTNTPNDADMADDAVAVMASILEDDDSELSDPPDDIDEDMIDADVNNVQPAASTGNVRRSERLRSGAT